jgi:hypothetical protein
LPSKSLSRSSLLSFQKYSSLLAGNDPFIPGVFELLATETLTSSQNSFEFTSLDTLAADYQHIQVRWVLRSNRADSNSRALVRFNSDSSSSYSNSYLGSTGSAVFSGNNSPSYSTGIVSIDGIAGGNSTTGTFGGAVLDILNPFTSKNKTVRMLDGQAGTFNRISLNAGTWRNTNAITSLAISDLHGDFVAESRVSIYGLRGA